MSIVIVSGVLLSWSWPVGWIGLSTLEKLQDELLRLPEHEVPIELLLVEQIGKMLCSAAEDVQGGVVQLHDDCHDAPLSLPRAAPPVPHHSVNPSAKTISLGDSGVPRRLTSRVLKRLSPLSPGRGFVTFFRPLPH